MAQTVLLKRSSIAGNVPGSSDLALGEIAVNTADGAVYIKKGNNDIVAVADNDILHIDTTNSRVGIGTTSPAGNLHIKSVGNVGDALLIVEADADNNVESDNPRIELRQDSNFVSGALYLEGNAAVTATNSIQNALLLDAKASSGDGGILQFATGGLAANQSGGPTNSSVRMTILRDGNVGIGTTSPDAKLQVTGADIAGTTPGVSGDNYFSGGTGDENYLEFSTFNTTSNNAGHRINVSNSTGALYLGVNDSDTLVVAANGNVGVGTNSPSEKLDVNGTITISGDIKNTKAGGDLQFNGGSTGYVKSTTGLELDFDSDNNQTGMNFKITHNGGTELFKISNSGAIRFNQAYTFPTADGSANQVLQTDGSGNLTFGTAAGGGVSISNNANNRVLTGDGTNANAEANLTFDGSTLGVTGSITSSSTATASSGFITTAGLALRDYTTDARIHLGDNGGGSSGVFAGRRLTDNTGLLYGTYWAYDAFWDDGNENWTANRSNLGRKWKAEMGYHLDSFKVSRFDGTVSSPWSQADWDDLLTISSATSTFATDVNLTSGHVYKINGTTVIDSSRNLTNIGTISSGAITSSSTVGAIGIKNSSNVEVIDLDHATYTKIKDPEGNDRLHLGDSGDTGNYYSNTTHHVRSKDGATYFTTTNSGGFNVRTGTVQINGTTVISSSRNLTNIGTISSGAITSSGASSGRYTGLEVVNTTNAGGTETAIGLGVVSAGTNACDVKLVANRVGANSGSDFYIEQTDSSGTQQETFRITESGNATFAGTLEATSFSDGTISGVTFIDEDSFSTNSATRVPTQQSIKAYVDAQVAGVVDTAPAALNTLNELAAALGDDASFSTTTSTALGNRLRVDTASQGLTGTQQANAITNLGITATKAELNYVDGVTSNIQTQLDGKQASGSYVTLSGSQTITGAKTFSGTTTVGDLVINTANTTISTTQPAIRKGGGGEMFLDAPGHIIVNIDTNNNNTDRVFAVRTNSTTSNLFSVNESGNITVTGTVDGVDIAARDHDAVTLAGSPDYITISGQTITRNQIDLTSDVTGVLPSAKLDSDTAHLSGSQTFTGAKTFNSSVIIGGATYASYGSGSTDITGLINGSTFGSIQYASNSGHHVIGLRDNDNADSFAIISGTGNWATDSTYDKLVFRVQADGTVTVGGGNLGVTGNITLTGTVDGRDIATDGTKLDTIDTNADITPSWVPSSNPNYLTSVPNHSAALITSGTLNSSRLPTDLGSTKTLSGANAILKLQETDVTNSPTWWHVADGGNYSIRLNNSGTYPIQIVTNATNNAVSNIVLGYNTDFSAGIDVTGNITVSGTVDGRDVATDGSKLDGIESGATADQTQSEINALGITATGLSGTPNITVGTITSTGNSQFNGNVQVGDTVNQNAFGLLQVNQTANNDEEGIGILSASHARSMRLWVDETSSYINSGNGGAANLVFNEAITVSSGGNLTGVGVIRTADGTNTSVSYGFNGDINTGMYSPANHELGFATNGGQRLKLDSTGATVTGNLAVTGTVDGRDVASDGTKLDGISAGADVTPSWVPSSDPGYLTSSSTQSKYLRSDANDDFSGTLNYTPDTGTILSVDGQAILQRMTANGAITIGHDDAVIIAGGDTSSVMNTNISNATETVFIGAEGGLIVHAFPNNDTTWTNRKTLSFDGANGLIVPNASIDINGNLSATTKSFDIPHPSKEGMRLKYGVLEGPENGVYVRGKSKEKVILLPDYWVDLVHEDTITVQLTAIGKGQDLYVEDIKDNKVYVNGENYFYYIQAERKDVERFEVEYEI